MLIFLIKSEKKSHSLEYLNETLRKFHVYPTYNYACPIVDFLQGVSYVFRSNKYNEKNDRAEFIWEHLQLNKPF